MSSMKYPNIYRAAALALLLSLLPAPASARVQGYPHLDNETLGMFNLLRDALAGPAHKFDTLYWGDPTLEQSFGEMLGLTRYLVAASAYTAAAVHEHTPAYRAPYQLALRQAIEKMLHQRAWQDWMAHYGNDPLAKDNLMFKGFLFYMLALYQQVSGDPRYESTITLTYKDGKKFTTDIKRLAAQLHQEAAGAKTQTGQVHYGIACEPGQVFVICNTQHRVGYLVYDRIFGSKYAAANAGWLDWTRKQMLEPKSQLFYFMYRPAKAAGKQFETRLSGLYNAITIAFVDALDPTWGTQLFPRFRDKFIRLDGKSHYGPGTAVAVDRVTQQSSPLDFGVDSATTGMAMVLARAHGEQQLYGKLRAGWQQFFGAPAWEPNKTRYGYTFSPMIPLVFQNTIPLWARVTDASHNIRKNATRPWSKKDFALPYLSAVGNARAFVNQAVYDRAKQRLVLTVNGGAATRASTTLTVENLDADQDYIVQRDGEPYEQVKRAGRQLVITTPALSATEESYVVLQNETVKCLVGTEDGCQVGAGGALPWLLGLLLLLAVGRRARRVGLLLAGAALLLPGSARAQEVDLPLKVNYRSAAVAGKQRLCVQLTASARLRKIKAVLSREGKRRVFKVRAMRIGQTRPICWKEPPGRYEYLLGLSALHAGARRSKELTVAINYLPPIRLVLDRDGTNLGQRKLVLRLNHPADRAEVTIIGQGGKVLLKQQTQLAAAEPGSPLVISWSRLSGQIVRIDLKVFDTDGFWVGTSAVPWTVHIPHEEVVFASDSWVIPAAEAPKLDAAVKRVVKALKDHAAKLKVNLYVGGFTDTMGSTAHNRTLSANRARAIAGYFSKRGVKVPIFFRGYGEEALAVKTADQTDEPKNRRALYILSSQPPVISSQIKWGGWRAAR